MAENRKRKVSPAYPAAYNDIQSTLSRIKPKLADKDPGWPSLRSDLLKVATLAEALIKIRPRARKEQWLEHADELDREGVALWNVSVSHKEVEDENYRPCCAALRRTTSHGRRPTRRTCSVKEARCRPLLFGQDVGCASAWREGNASVAEFMLEKLTALAEKLLEIGKDILKSTPQQLPAGVYAEQSVKWLQCCYTFVEPLEDGPGGEFDTLKRSILRSLTRAYYISSSYKPEHLVKAETCVQELVAIAERSIPLSSMEYQQICWMQVAILKQGNASHNQLLEAFKSLIHHMTFSESCVTDLLQELRSMKDDQ
ncbi:uncharacterized protein BXZ73DRAFT_78478 [Epithele typhae]|uniref:uncharacterized protein n=1 Tax=Epithele typhae TaxID=378194 RepID=UPI0020079F7A|nr:uncharacterized protein BXZ73DRAFT_78478 [Epithele typhae]KAH9927421.1 hypothetical protein BXZ73DRAFT_78478 [Epithele typhae]